MRAGLLPLLTAAFAAAAEAQTLEARFLSEFRRLGPDGEIIAQDAAGKPREIISPAIIRNGYTSFHIVLNGPAGKDFMLYIASNPDRVLRPVVYRVTGPDRLEAVKTLSVAGKFNEHGAAVFWLDIWTPAATPVRRIRLEAQLNVGEDFVITPLELRVQAGVVPPGALPTAPVKPGGNSGSGPFALVGRALCGVPGVTPAGTGDGLSILGKIMRNAGQDILLARAPGAGTKRSEWCAARRDDANPESYLRLRDSIWRASQQ